jgi:hypothetical protein
MLQVSQLVPGGREEKEVYTWDPLDHKNHLMTERAGDLMLANSRLLIPVQGAARLGSVPDPAHLP